MTIPPNLPPRHFAPEAVGLIAKRLAEGSYLAYKSTLASCMLVSKVFAEEFRPFLFEELHIPALELNHSGLSLVAVGERARISNAARKQRELDWLTRCFALLQTPDARHAVMVKRVTVLSMSAGLSDVTHRLLATLTSVTTIDIGEECTHLNSSSPFYAQIGRLGVLPNLRSVVIGSRDQRLSAPRWTERIAQDPGSFQLTFHNPCAGCPIPSPMRPMCARATELNATLSGVSQATQRVIDISRSSLRSLNLSLVDFEIGNPLNLQAPRSLLYLSVQFVRLTSTAHFDDQSIASWIFDSFSSMPNDSGITSVELIFEGLNEHEISSFLRGGPTLEHEDHGFGALGRLLSDPVRYPNLKGVHINFTLEASAISTELLSRVQEELLPYAAASIRIRDFTNSDTSYGWVSNQLSAAGSIIVTTATTDKLSVGFTY
ncbi:hypothetical protein BKA70DRAFT_1572491 [Coprinopsis sp. MPI-PUGE-AT-0042]|nr:hypothetical protein BKA70DRAFT_1572491 [Coprinopsis sp. MPI-PUGE-AT-0042]